MLPFLRSETAPHNARLAEISFMPWTRRQVKKLLSSGSPLSAAQKTSMKSELHSNPALGHARKGSAALKKPKRAGTNLNIFRERAGL